MAKNKQYVVWKGLNPGVYDNWAECKMQVEGQEGAKYKSFETREEAFEAFEKGYTHYLKTASSSKAAASLAPKRLSANRSTKAWLSMLPAAVIRGIWNTGVFTRLPDRRYSISVL